MSRKFNKKAIVAIIAVIAVISIVGGTLAWFSTESSLSQKFNVSGFTAGADIFFVKNDQKIDSAKYIDKSGLYNLSLDKEAENYIGNLRVNVRLDGGKACVRVKLHHEWNDAQGNVAQYTTAVPYVFAENWYDNRNEDYCVYYQAKNYTGKSDFKETEFIKGFDETSFDTLGLTDGVSVKLHIEVDAVQVNRYPQLWNIEKLPWK